MRASVLENESFPSFEISMETSISVFYVLEDPSIQKQDEYKKVDTIDSFHWFERSQWVLGVLRWPERGARLRRDPVFDRRDGEKRTSKGKGELSGKRTNYKDAFLQVHPEPKPRSPSKGARAKALTFPTDNPVKRIDYIIYKQGSGVHVRVDDSQLIGLKPWSGTETDDLKAGMMSKDSALWPSDHRGVYADFTFLFRVCWQTFCCWLVVEDAQNCRNDSQNAGYAVGGGKFLRGASVVQESAVEVDTHRNCLICRYETAEKYKESDELLFHGIENMNKHNQVDLFICVYSWHRRFPLTIWPCSISIPWKREKQHLLLRLEVCIRVIYHV